MPQSFIAELRHAARRLRRARGFSVIATLTLAIALAGTVAMLSLVNAVLIQPLPYPDPDRLVAFRLVSAASGVSKGGLSEGEYLYFSEHSQTLENVGAYIENAVTLSDREQAERVQVALVTPNCLAALGASPFLGRLISADDARPGAPTVVILAHGLWARRYGADVGIVGRTIQLNRSRVQVVGVMREGFGFPQPATQIWYSLTIEPSTEGVRDPYLRGLARLRPGIASAKLAEAELNHQIQDVLDLNPAAKREAAASGGLRAVVLPLKDEIVAEARRPLWILLTAVGFVLLTAWVNVVTLFLVRAENQRGELAVHTAVGATQAQLVWRFFAESLVLSTLASLFALPLVQSAIKWRFGFSPGDIPRLEEFRLDGTVLALTLALAFATALVIGFAALPHALRLDAGAALTSGANFATSQAGQQRAQRILVGLQFALSFVLVVSSALMVQSFWRLRHADLGFEPAGVLTMQVSLPARQYPTYRETAAFYERLLDELATLPGITHSGAVSWLPLTVSEGELTTPVMANRPPNVDFGQSQAAPANATLALATPAYFETMRIRFIEGRTFTPEDMTGSEIPVVMSAALADTLFGGGVRTGQRLRLGELTPKVWHTVVGVVASVSGESIAAGPAKVLYLPVMAQLSREVTLPLVPRDMSVVVRGGLPPIALTPSLRATVRRLDPTLGIGRLQPMIDLVAASTARTRLATVLLLVSAVEAVLLAIVGIYGVLSYTVNLRSRELGMRFVLGATRKEVIAAVLKDGIVVALAGIAGGVAAALALARTLEALVYDVSPTDPVSYVVAVVFLLIVSVLASYLPAQRAGRMDPVMLLRVR